MLVNNVENVEFQTIKQDVENIVATDFCGIFPVLEHHISIDILFFNHIFNDGICTCEINSRIDMAKAAFNKKKKNLFTSTLDLNLRKKLVKCYIWSMPLYGAETWTLRAADHKHLESFEMWC